MGEPSEAAVGAWVGLVRAQHAVLSAVEAELKAAGFPPLAWYDVLLELRRAPGARLRQSEIRERVLLAQYSVSRLADRLAAAGYLLKEPCPEDGRGSVLRLTAAGRRLLRRMWPVYARAIQRHVGDALSEREAARLAALLGKLAGRARPP